MLYKLIGYPIEELIKSDIELSIYRAIIKAPLTGPLLSFFKIGTETMRAGMSFNSVIPSTSLSSLS